MATGGQTPSKRCGKHLGECRKNSGCYLGRGVGIRITPATSSQLRDLQGGARSSGGPSPSLPEPRPGRPGESCTLPAPCSARGAGRGEVLCGGSALFSDLRSLFPHSLRGGRAHCDRGHHGKDGGGRPPRTVGRTPRSTGTPLRSSGPGTRLRQAPQPPFCCPAGCCPFSECEGQLQVQLKLPLPARPVCCSVHSGRDEEEEEGQAPITRRQKPQHTVKLRTGRETLQVLREEIDRTCYGPECNGFTQSLEEAAGWG